MTRFERAMTVLAVHEGGYVNHPDDPGGATNKGVTQRTYDAHMKRKGLPTRSVRHITDEDVFDIYLGQYWNAVRADDLPPGLAYCVFDAAVNSGPAQAAKWLQDCVGVDQDGIIGEQTLAAIPDDIHAVIDAYCDKRLAFMKRLKHWPSFKNGWTRRVAEVRAQSKKWAEGYEVAPSVEPVQPKAAGPESKTSTLKDMLSDKGAIAAAGSLIASVGTAAGGSGPFAYAMAAVLVMTALTGIWWVVRGRHT